MADIDNNKRMELLIPAGERLLRRQWVLLWIRKVDIKGAYHLIINDHKLIGNEDFVKYM